MDVREFPVLSDGDRALVDRLSAGLGENAGRVLAYLLRRDEDPALENAATSTAIRIGTGLSESAAREGLDELESVKVVDRTTVRTASAGRPPNAWYARDRPEPTIRRAFDRHADRLLEQGERFDEHDAGADRERRDESETEAHDEFVVGLNWRANALHLPLFAARTNDAGGLAISFEEYDGSSAAARAVAAGDVDVGVAGAATVLRERALGRPIVPVAVLFPRSTAVIYATREAFGGPFDRIDRLRGRRLGTSASSETELLGRLMLEQAGVRETVEIVSLEGEEREALETGTVDAVTGMYPDPRRLERNGQTTDAVTIADQFPVYGPTLIATRDGLAADRERLATFLAAATDGWATARADPSVAAADAAERSAEPADRIERTFDRAAVRFGATETVRKRGWGWHSPAAWRDLRTALSQGGVFDRD
ncbi:ABC transporter substrate-binding protein [Saliphagus sp. GCM10025334]